MRSLERGCDPWLCGRDSMVYLDNAASTRPAAEVAAAVARGMVELWANPASAHGPGTAATRAVEAARTQVAALLRAEAAEITFTSGGTEANALAVLGVARAARGRHVIATAIEHPSVLRNLEQLRSQGFELTLVAPDPDGVVPADALLAALRPDTALVAVMLVNNELGTIQPVQAVAGALRARVKSTRPHLHVDAVQGVGWLPLTLRHLGADSVAVSAHKLHGPKGVGALWVRPGARLEPLWDGGRQERGLRSGTENVPGVMGFGQACRLALDHAGAAARVAGLRDRLEASIAQQVPEARPTVAASPALRAPHICSIRLDGLPAEPLLHALEAAGVIAAAGSACASRTRGPSHVLAALGIGERSAVLRLSLSRDTTEADVDAAAKALRTAVDEIAAVVHAPQRARRRS